MSEIVAVRALCSDDGRPVLPGSRDYHDVDDEILYIPKDKYEFILENRFPSWHKKFTERDNQNFDPFPHMAGIRFPDLIELLIGETVDPHNIISVGGTHDVGDEEKVLLFRCGFRVEGEPGNQYRRELWSLMSQTEMQYMQNEAAFMLYPDSNRDTQARVRVVMLDNGFTYDGAQFDVGRMSALKFNLMRQALAGYTPFTDLTPEVRDAYSLMQSLNPQEPRKRMRLGAPSNYPV